MEPLYITNHLSQIHQPCFCFVLTQHNSDTIHNHQLLDGFSQMKLSLFIKIFLRSGSLGSSTGINKSCFLCCANKRAMVRAKSCNNISFQDLCLFSGKPASIYSCPYAPVCSFQLTKKQMRDPAKVFDHLKNKHEVRYLGLFVCLIDRLFLFLF